MAWKDKKQVKKGNIGERIVREYLEKKGYIIYEPKTDGSHAIDKIAINSQNKLVLVEVKTKAKMNKYNATGFDIRSYKRYKELINKYNLDLYVFFVDEMLGSIYGNKLSYLDLKEKDSKGDLYPNVSLVKGIILFSFEKMKSIHKLSEKDIIDIKKYNTRNYTYNF